MRLASIYTILLLCLAPASFGGAAPALRIDGSSPLKAVPAEPYLEIWEDASKEVGIDHILASPPVFRDLSLGPPEGMGYSKAIFWIRFQVENSSGVEQRLYLEATDPQQYLDFFALAPGTQEIVDRQEVGAFRLMSQQRFKYRFPVLEVIARPGLQTYYFRLEAVAVTFPYNFWTKDALLEKAGWDRAALSFFFGCFVIMALYNLLLGMTTRRREYFLYCGYLVSFMLLQLFVTGSGFIYLGDAWTPLARCMSLWVGVTIIFTLQFSISFLRLGPGRLNATRWILHAYSGLAVAFCIYSYWDRIDALKLLPFALTGMPFVIYAGFRRAMAGDRPAVYYSIGWLCLLLGAGVVIFYYTGIYKGSHEVSWFMLIAVALETTFFSLAIGERLRHEIETSLHEQAILLDRHRREVEARSHAFQQLGKVFYPHQLQKMEQGHELESTMPTTAGWACVIQLDIVNSSQIWSTDRKEFLIGFLKRCHEIMMHNYDSATMQADAYRIKEMGDGFLCSVGYPFALPPASNTAQRAVEIAERFIEVFRRCVEKLSHAEPVYCSIGIAAGDIEGFYPNSGTKEYDLYGHSIILANRYESLRKHIFETVDFDVLIIQDEVFQKLPAMVQADFTSFDLIAANLRVRDDPLAQIVHFRSFRRSSRITAA